MKKILLVGLLSAALFSCGGDKKDDSKALKEETATIFNIQNGKVFNPELPVFKASEEKTHLKLISVASQNQTNETEAFNLMLASQPLPDLIGYNKLDRLENLGSEGGVIPLEDLIEKHAPNIKKFFEENPRYKKDAQSIDGHIYVIPQYYDYFNLRTSLGYFLRYDWLKKLNLKEPKTIDELYDVLVAFRDKDPNGNGKKDEVPVFVRGAQLEIIVFPLLDIFKANIGFALRDGKVVYGPAQPEFKYAVEQLHKWYQEGLLDKEIFTRGTTARDYFLSNNLGGFTADWIVSTSSYNGKLQDVIPGFDFSILLPPVVNGNNKTEFSRPTYEGGMSISKDAKDPVRLIKWMDFWFSPEGRRLWNFGIEGEDYTIVDGKPVFTDKILKNPKKNPLATLRDQGAQYRIVGFQDYNYELGWASPEAKKNIEKYMQGDVIVEGLPGLKFTPKETKEVVDLGAPIRAYTLEKVQQWILGTKDINKEWNEYLDRLQAMHLDRLQSIEQKAYDNFNK